MKRKKIHPLRALRLAAGLTLQDVSRKTGIPESTITAVENGRGRSFNIGIKNKLADAFRADPRELFPEFKKQIAAVEGRTVRIQEFIAPAERKK